MSPIRYRLKPLSFAIAAIVASSFGNALADTAENPPTQADQAVDAKDKTLSLDAVVISGSRTNIVSGGALGARTDLQTPFSTKSVDSAQIEEKQAKSIAKVFEGEAGVEAKGGSYVLEAQALNVRGLRLDFANGYKIDGHPFQMYGVELPLELFESVQLLKGATGFLYGIGSPGGTVNYVSKKPGDKPIRSFAVGYSQKNVFSQHLDLGDRFGEDDRFGYRFNLVNEHGTTYNGAKLDRQAGALALDARLNSSLTWRFNTLFQERDLKGGVAAISAPGTGAYAYSGTTLPAPISGRSNLTGYDSSYYDSSVYAASTGLNWAFADNWTLDFSYSYTFKRIDSRDETLYLRNAQGDYNLSLRQLYRPTLIYNSAQLRLDGEVSTGNLKHQIVAGLEYWNQTRSLNTGGQNDFYPSTGTLPSSNLYAPAHNLAYNGYSPHTYYRISDDTSQSIFVSDTLKFNPQWSLLLGLRYLDYLNDNYRVNGTLSSSYHKKPVTPTAALLFTPRPDTTIYASYVEALQSGGIVSSTSGYVNGGEQLAPIESKQYELGIKTNREDWSLAAALFRIDRGAGYATAANRYVNDGTVRYDGLELNGRYRPTKDLTVFAGATWLDATYVEAAAALKGKEVEAVPRFQSTLGAEKTFSSAPGLRVHGNVNYTGKQYVNNSNTLQTASYELVNLGASYRVPLGKNQLTYRAEISNLFDKNYWIAASSNVVSNALVIGAPRTLTLNVRYDF